MRHKVGRRYWGTWEWVLSGADALCIKKEAKNPHVKTPKSGQIYKCAYFPLSPKGGTRERRIKEIRGFQITGREPQCKKIEIRGAQFPAYIYRTKQTHSRGGQGYPVSFDINELQCNQSINLVKYTHRPPFKRFRYSLLSWKNCSGNLPGAAMVG